MSDASQLPPVTFSSFVISLAQSALVHLGEVSDPATGAKAPDATLARHTIDLLGMLEEKTKGNLDDEEAKLIGNILHELRTRFVETSGGR